MREVHKQSAPFSVKGHWWLPNSERRVAGELHYDEESISLSLFSGLTDAIADSLFSANPEETNHAIVYGESQDNVRITVLRLFYTKWTPDITTLAIRPGTKVAIRSATLRCGTFIEGAHLQPDELQFRTCRIEVPNINSWLGVSPFKVDIAPTLEKISLHYTSPNNETLNLNGQQICVRFIHSVAPPGSPYNLAPTISYLPQMEIESPKPLPLSQLLDHSHDIVSLLSMVYGGPVASTELLLFQDEDEFEPLSIFFPRHKVSPKEYTAHDFLIRRKDIDEVLKEVFENWLGANENLKRARRMLLSSERRPSSFIELRFLPLVQAAEVLSNEAPQTTIVNVDEFREIRNRMLDSVPDDIPPELTHSIKNSLQWANGRSLRGKIRSLLSELQDETCNLFSVDKERFIAGVVRTRNYYTHYAAKSREKILNGMELHWAIQKLSLMIRIVLLVRAGVPETKLQKAIRSNERLAQERSAWRNATEDGTAHSDAESELE